MEKKVIDIIPPRKKKEIIEKIPSAKGPSFKFEKPGLKITTPKFPFKKGLLIIPLILIIIGIIAGLNLAKAEIKIEPKTDTLTFKTKVTIDKSAETTNFLDKVIPGKVFQTEKTVSGEFTSSGEISKAEKAEGLIRIYNNYNTLQVLVATTRFQAPLEKFQPSLEEGENPWFRTTERVAIPAKGYQDVKVIADSPGEKYNIEPSTFSVPGLAGTPQYTFIYGKSLAPMKGGALEKTPQVNQEDLDKAKEELTARAKDECSESLKNKIPAGFDFLKEALEIKIIEASSSAKSGAELERFNYQVKAEAQTPAFKVEDLKNFANEFILSQIPENKIIHQESLKVNCSLADANLEAGKIIISLDLEVKIYSKIEETFLKRALAKKSVTEGRLFLEEQPEINEVQIKLSPFWVKEIPEAAEKIKINLRID